MSSVPPFGDSSGLPGSQPSSLFGSDQSTSTLETSLMSGAQQNEGDAAAIAGQAAQNTKSQEQQVEQMQPPKRANMMQSMPFLLALTALGGVTSGMHGRVMLGALGGMAKGIVDGNEQAFNDSMKQYKANWQKLQSLFSLQDQYYNELYQAYGKTAEGQMQALEMVSKITNDEFTQASALRRMGQTDQSIALARQRLAEQMRHNNFDEQIKSGQLAVAKQKAQMAVSQGQLTPQEALIWGKTLDILGTVPSGWGLQQIKARIQSSMAAHPGESPEEIAKATANGVMHGEVLRSAMGVLGRREANVSSAVGAITGQGGQLDLAIQYAKEAGLGNNKPINWKNLKLSQYQNNPKMRQFIQAMTDLRAEWQQALGRGGITSEGQAGRALEAIPDVVTLQELQQMKTSLPSLAAAVMKGTISSEENIMSQGPGGTDTAAMPSVGEVQDGYKYIGGDPSQKSSWEKVQP